MASRVENATVDAVVTMGNREPDSAAIANEQAGVGGRVKLASFNTDQARLDPIKGGKHNLDVNQYGYSEGFFAVFLLDA